MSIFSFIPQFRLDSFFILLSVSFLLFIPQFGLDSVLILPLVSILSFFPQFHLDSFFILHPFISLVTSWARPWALDTKHSCWKQVAPGRSVATVWHSCETAVWLYCLLSWCGMQYPASLCVDVAIYGILGWCHCAEVGFESCCCAEWR